MDTVGQQLGQLGKGKAGGYDLKQVFAGTIMNVQMVSLFKRLLEGISASIVQGRQ